MSAYWKITVAGLLVASTILFTNYIRGVRAPTPLVQSAAPSTALIQLGAQGVTTTGGNTNYGNCLVKTTTNGVIDITLLQMPNPLALYMFDNVFFIDPINGVDTNGNGAVESPLKTFAYAYLTEATGPAVYVFAPGTNDVTMVLEAGTEANQPMTFIGWDPYRTYLEGTIQSQLVAQDTSLNIYGVTLQALRQMTLNNVTVNIYGLGGLETLTRDNTSITAVITSDPSTRALPADSWITYSNMHYAAAMGYAATNSSAWTNNYAGASDVPTTVTSALDELAQRHYPSSGVNLYDLAVWNGTNWVPFANLTNYYTIAEIDAQFVTTNTLTIILEDYWKTNELATIFNILFTNVWCAAPLAYTDSGQYGNVAVSNSYFYFWSRESNHWLRAEGTPW